MSKVLTPVQDSPSRPSEAPRFLPPREERDRLRRRRHGRSLFSRSVVVFGGVSVIVALSLIFVFLFLEVLPLLKGADADRVGAYPAPGGNPPPTLHVAGERYQEVAVRFAQDGKVHFFEPASGTVRQSFDLPIPEGVEITSSGIAEPRTRVVALGLSDGRALLVRHQYDLTYPDDVRLVTPRLEFPLGEEPVVVDPEGRPLRNLAVQRATAGGMIVAAVPEGGPATVVRFEATTSFLTGEVVLQRREGILPVTPDAVRQMRITMDLRDLFVASDGGLLRHFDLTSLDAMGLVDEARVLGEGVEISSMDFLLGTVSIIVGGSDGSVTQWFPIRDEDNVRRLSRIRGFEPHGSPVTSVRPGYARKGFVTADSSGNVALRYATSGRTLLWIPLGDRPILEAIETPRADGLFALEDGGTLHFLEVDNRHPEVSFAALWDRVWYEGRSQPEYIWQSSSATDEFEPKFSLVPLTVGTLKAAFYAMLFATPLALLGALYTAYFMRPVMRSFVKPTIEIMEALPTVILGFLAGLWLAPFAENHLPAVFSILLLLPVAILAFGLLWQFGVPQVVRHRIPVGWEAAILIPVVMALGWVCISLSPLVEIWFFDGSMRQWFTEQGITYDQRNAMVVGAAMGFAVIPTIFSLAEDALFNVPKHLSQGSLALGASNWQTAIRVVLPTASPGLFAAIMIGLGRAVGETMIVLMATGNSPVVNFNIFEGMRTLSANIAVEMPETEVGGTHYRIIFLSAFVLLTLTFAFNTVAEWVRQRLRKKYQAI
jgi:phosphate transport system permease protein